MSLLKDETTVRLDELTSLADETMTFYEDLIDEIDDAAAGLLAAHVRDQKALLQSVIRARQSHGGLPQAGDVERGHLFAAVASARRFFGGNDSAVVDRLIEANNRLREAAVTARDYDPPPEEEGLIRRLIDSCDSFGAVLRRHASTQR